MSAIELGIAHGGWCPRGRRAEDGSIPAQYELRETDSASYDVRTESNITDSDGNKFLDAFALTIRLEPGSSQIICDLDFLASFSDSKEEIEKQQQAYEGRRKEGIY